MRHNVKTFAVFIAVFASQLHQSANAQQPSLPHISNPTGNAGAQKSCEKPEYPAHALRNSIQGTTRIRFYVNRYGEVTKAELVSSSGSELLDNAAISALTKCNFKPSIQDGLPIESTTVVEYAWRIQ